jgi:hypothetical protein
MDQVGGENTCICSKVLWWRRYKKEPAQISRVQKRKKQAVGLGELMNFEASCNY